MFKHNYKERMASDLRKKQKNYCIYTTTWEISAIWLA